MYVIDYTQANNVVYFYCCIYCRLHTQANKDTGILDQHVLMSTTQAPAYDNTHVSHTFHTHSHNAHNARSQMLCFLLLLMLHTHTHKKKSITQPKHALHISTHVCTLLHLFVGVHHPCVLGYHLAMPPQQPACCQQPLHTNRAPCVYAASRDTHLCTQPKPVYCVCGWVWMIRGEE